MAEINTGGGDKGGKGKPKKIQLRVDFTPMVDMNMLLITFFMFCTTLSKPQIMNLVVPSKDKKDILKEPPKTIDTRTTTIILGGNDVVFYYYGKANYEDYASLHQTDYSPEGLRAMLVEKNGAAVRKVADLRKEKQSGKLSDSEFNEQVSAIRSDKEGQVVIIKPMPASTYKNLVDVLDEMQICSIGTYALDDMTEGDTFLVENFMQQGALTNQAAEAATGR